MAVMMMARVAGVAPVALTKKCWKFLKRPKNIVNMSTKILQKTAFSHWSRAGLH